MPLIRLSDSEAISNRKTNPVAGWGDRGSSNRVEPIAKPGFDVPFKIAPGEKIFTVGSCFARNVESELLRRGFAVPIRELFQRPDFAHLGLEIINNYGTPSIFNEIAWAFGEQEFEPEHHLLEVRESRFADIHLAPTMRPESWDVVLGRRLAIAEAYRLAATCSTIIMTLGLCELWFDTRTGCYINVAPRPSLLTNHPGRFELHVLSFEDVYQYLEKAILILLKHAPHLRILMTVSPVPLMSTHRPVDVMVANTYSKSVLRASAEAVVAKYPFITYYPSYESVTLSDRKIAWKQDLVHVTEEMVALNVSRMVEAFVDTPNEIGDIDNEVSAIESAKTASRLGPQASDAFFGCNGEWSEKSLGFALEHARYFLKSGRASEALGLLARYDTSDVNVAIVTGEGLTAMGRAADAVALLDPFCQPDAKSVALWDAFNAAALAEGDADRINTVLWRYRSAVPRKAPAAYLRAAKWFHAQGSKIRAISLCKAIIEEPLPSGIALDLTKFLIELGDLASARAALERVGEPNGAQRILISRLQAFLA